MKLEDYISLSQGVKNLEIKKVKLLDVREIIDCEYDKISGRGISVLLNNGVKIKWFERSDKVIACAVLMKKDKHKNIIKNRVLDCLSDRLFMFNRINNFSRKSALNWDDSNFRNAWLVFKNIKSL